MAFNLGDIFLTFKAKSEGIKEVVGQIKDTNKQAADGVRKLDNFAAGFKDFTKVTGGALITVGTGLTIYAKKATDFTKEYVANSKRLAREIGTNIQEASRLTYAFTRLGLSSDDVSTSFGIFSKRIKESTADAAKNRVEYQALQSQIEKTQFEIKTITAEVKKNGDKSGELGIKLRGLQSDLAGLQIKAQGVGTAFDKLGIELTDDTGKTKDFNAILFEVADKFKTMPDGVEKTALSMELFGRSGKDMIKVLNQGSAGIKALEAQADKLGITLTDKTVAGFARMVEAGKKLKENQDAIKIAVGTLTAPVLARYNEELARLVGRFQDLDQPAKQFLATVLAFGGPVATGLGGLITFIGSIGDASSAIDKFAPKIPIVGRFLQVFGGFITNPWVLVIGAIAVAVGLLLNHFGELQPIIDIIGSLLTDLWEILKVTLKPAFDSIKLSLEQLAPLWPPLLSVLKFLAEFIGAVVMAAIVGLATAIAGIVFALSYLAAGVLLWVNLLKDLIADAVDRIVAKWNQLVALPARLKAWMADAANTLKLGVQSIKSTIDSFVTRFFDSGKALLDAFGRGIVEGFNKVKNKVTDGLNWIRDRLPHSDAKEGPLSDLTLSGRKLMETLAVGVGRGAGSLYNAVESSFAGLPAGMVSAGVSASASVAGGFGAGSAAASVAAANGDTHVHLHMDGVLTRSRGELRDTLIAGLEAVDEKLVAQGRQPLLRKK